MYIEEQKIFYQNDLDTFFAPRKTLVSKAYKRRISITFSLLEKYLHRGAHILDVGCAQGNISLILAEKGFNLVATDRYFSFIHYARMKYENGKINFIQCSGEALPFKVKFDAIILGEVLDLVAYPENVLKNCNILLRTGGVLLLSTLNGDAILPRIPSFNKIKDRGALEIRQRKFTPGTLEHLFIFRKRDIFNLLKAHGFIIRECCYWGTPFLTGRYGVRYLPQFLPLVVVNAVDLFLTRIPVLKSLLCSGLVIIARKEIF